MHYLLITGIHSTHKTIQQNIHFLLDSATNTRVDRKHLNEAILIMLQNKNVYFLNWNGAKPERFEKKQKKY